MLIYFTKLLHESICKKGETKTGSQRHLAFFKFPVLRNNAI